MMKLTLCVPLIWMLSSSGGALKCVQEDHRSDFKSSKDPELCNSTNVHCATVASPDLINNPLELYYIRRTCLPSFLCGEGDQLFSMSYDYARLTTSLQCCSTDGCNNKNTSFSAADEQKPNGLQCVTCSLSDLSCNKTLQCVGVQNRCIAVNGTEYGKTYELRGCASANLCEGDTEPKLKLLFARSINIDHVTFTAPKCSGSSPSNSAPADKLSVISLLLVLVALSVC